MKVSIINKTTPNALRQSASARIRAFLHDLNCNYPHFDEWLNNVLLKTATDERTIVMCLDDERIAGLVILKDTADEKKICTLRVASGYRRRGVGTSLIGISQQILGTEKPLITVSDEHINVFRHFLSRFGFVQKSQVKSVYNYGHNEYYFNKPYQREYVLLSIKPEFAEKIMNGQKNVEFRKRCFDKCIRHVYVYASSPVRKIVGRFEVEEIEEGHPEKLWCNHHEDGGISRQDYNSYFQHRSHGYAILIKKAVRLRTAISLDDVMGRPYRPPQNYNNLDNVDALRRLLLLE